MKQYVNLHLIFFAQQCTNINEAILNLQVAKACPNDKAARLKYNECKKIVHQQAFAKAIAVDDKKSVVETLDIDSMGM